MSRKEDIHKNHAKYLKRALEGDSLPWLRSRFKFGPRKEIANKLVLPKESDLKRR